MKKIISLIALLSLMSASVFALGLDSVMFKTNSGVGASGEIANQYIDLNDLLYPGDTIFFEAQLAASTGYGKVLMSAWTARKSESGTSAADGSVVDYIVIPLDYDVTIGSQLVQFSSGGKWCNAWMKNLQKRPVAATGVSVSPATTDVSMGGTFTPTSTVTPASDNSSVVNDTVTWSSDDTNVATVDANTGVITGVAIGTVNIIATTNDGGFKDTCAVTVIAAPIAVEGITINTQATELDKLDSLTLATTFTPDNATNKNVTWTSLNQAVATVDTLGKVKGVDYGTAKIVVTTEDGGYEDTCDITVVQAAYIAFDNKANYIDPNQFDTAGVMSVTVNYAMGANHVLDNAGIAFRLRQLDGGWAPQEYDYLFMYTDSAGTSNGTITHDIDLTGATPTADLPAGDWYWLWIKAKDDAGTAYEAKTSGSDNILIVESIPTGLKVVENRLSIYPNPAENTLYLEGMQGAVRAAIYTLEGKQLMERELGAARSIDVSQLNSGNYILQVEDEVGPNAQMINIK